MSQIDWLAPLNVAPEPGKGIDPNWRQQSCNYRAAEFLVAADLSLAGYFCSMAAEGLPYDLVVDNGARIFTIQIKSSTILTQPLGNRLPRHEFCILRHGGRGKAAEDRMRDSYDRMVDVFALVSLTHRLIVYRQVIEIPRNIRVLPDKFTPEMQELSRREAFRR